MAADTKIEWADHTFNAWWGCKAISPGCDNCYAKALAKRAGRDFAVRTRMSSNYWQQPGKWNDNAAAFHAVHGRRQRVFCCSLADVFDNEVPAEWRHDLFNLIAQTPSLDWLLLTKRPQNIVRMVQEAGCIAGNGTRYLPGNVWLGATAEDQRRAEINVPALLKAKELTGAAIAFLSMEPLLGQVDLRHVGAGLGGCLKRQANYEASGAITRTPRIDWVIVGGESGPKARPMHPDWARSLRDQCDAAGVKFLFKQWGEWASTWHARLDPAVAERKPYVHVTPMCRLDGTNMSAPNYQLDRIGKRAAGRLLDGVTHDEFPESQ
jgi:protein gp37